MIKTPEELKLQRFRKVETLDSKIKHRTSLTFSDVPHHLSQSQKRFLIKK